MQPNDNSQNFIYKYESGQIKEEYYLESLIMANLTNKSCAQCFSTISDESVVHTYMNDFCSQSCKASWERPTFTPNEKAGIVKYGSLRAIPKPPEDISGLSVAEVKETIKYPQFSPQSFGGLSSSSPKASRIGPFPKLESFYSLATELFKELEKEKKVPVSVSHDATNVF